MPYRRAARDCSTERYGPTLGRSSEGGATGEDPLARRTIWLNDAITF
ncbi:hypothetical protein FTUN_5507 [Frigoriglobus tundricola]|uniref:Uncharacterized protein n=1 Tax=Frigoriglobus tundricola TaxID=2774151 RepID=A0A6M5YV01_9BACT|nr:hypothetical protein FTUN_5507 [Frigoriglobus tundricola]